METFWRNVPYILIFVFFSIALIAERLVYINSSPSGLRRALGWRWVKFFALLFTTVGFLVLNFLRQHHWLHYGFFVFFGFLAMTEYKYGLKPLMKEVKRSKEAAP